MTIEQIIEDYKNQLIEALGVSEESPVAELIEETTYMFLSRLDDD